MGNVRRPRHKLEPEYFEHHLSFTELYVRLLEANVNRRLAAVRQTQSVKGRNRALAGVYARVTHPLWRWRVMGDDLELPWKQYPVNGGKAHDRVIRPDAILELPLERRRLFIEGETGSHSIQARSPEKKGATLAKVLRYSEFVETFQNPADRRTWYARRFGDGFAPEVLFLVPTETRAANVRKAIADWQHRQLERSRLVVHVMTVERAAEFLLPHTGSAAVASPGTAETKTPAPTLSVAEQKIIVEFFGQLREDLHARMRRAQLQRGPMPQRPPLYYELKAIVARLNPGQVGD